MVNVARAAVLAVAVTLSHCTACEKSRTPIRYELQEGFTGWAILIDRRPGYPKLPLIDGNYIVRFGADGACITSSTMETGWANDRYFFVSGSGEYPREIPQRSIRAHSTGVTSKRSGAKMYFEKFYLGDDLANAPPAEQVIDEWYRKLVETK